jgi:hypothetical protein
MPTSILDDPDHWRKRAEETRTLAEQMNDPESRRTMFRTAEDYERLVEHAERRIARKLTP